MNNESGVGLMNFEAKELIVLTLSFDIFCYPKGSCARDNSILKRNKIYNFLINKMQMLVRLCKSTPRCYVASECYYLLIPNVTKNSHEQTAQHRFMLHLRPQ